MHEILQKVGTMSLLEWKQNKLKFLLDENVKKKLLTLLKSEGYDTISKPKGLSDNKLAEISKLEKRIFVTNDNDFLNFNKEQIHSLIWIKISQNDEDLLINSFSKLIDSVNPEKFEGKLFLLKVNDFEEFELSV